ncbi:hypothetical protein PR048_021707 [Dryococelus australis]|uniref:Uncharacterized protein n=1 Tax=Dryococelus australis TaxID=614101 RepID=A0ABQ9GZ58_9NEOP|nr:hypothetical protein PR048_021707 [Dryococelus australis]
MVQIRARVQLEEEILERFEAKPSTSTLQVAGWAAAKKQSRVFTESNYCIHVISVKCMRCTEMISTLCYICIHIVICSSVSPLLVLHQYILFTDECMFTREGIHNMHNIHVWASENPQFRSPNDVPLNIRLGLWYQHDGASAHFTRDVHVYIMSYTFGARWIGSGNPVSWPARSPYMSPLNFIVWGHMKSVMYASPVESRDYLVQQIQAAADTIRAIPNVFECMRRSMSRRCNACLDACGKTFEQFL